MFVCLIASCLEMAYWTNLFQNVYKIIYCIPDHKSTVIYELNMYVFSAFHSLFIWRELESNFAHQFAWQISTYLDKYKNMNTIFPVKYMWEKIKNYQNIEGQSQAISAPFREK